MEKLRCGDCGRFMRESFDDYIPFGCANPEAPEPYDPTYLCKKCSRAMYEWLLPKYKCCYRYGDWQKSKAEIQASKEAGLTWVGSSSIILPFSGREIFNQYATQWELQRGIPYLEYHKKRREENRCKCWRKLNEDGKCSRCNHSEVSCLCKYDSGMF